jgi:hypothetical protein
MIRKVKQQERDGELSTNFEQADGLASLLLEVDW